MRKLLMVVLCLFVFVSGVFAETLTKESAGNAFDGGAVLVSSMAVRRSGQISWSTTDSVFEGTIYTNTMNNKWLAKNKGPYEVIIDSCIWEDKGSYTLWATGFSTDTFSDIPYVIEDEEKIWLNAKTRQKQYLRALLTTTGWSTMYFMRTFDEQ